MQQEGMLRFRFPMRQLISFNILNPSSRTMALGFMQILTEMSTRSYFWGKVRKVGNFTAICEPIV
jgi:Zn-dependent M16 (insulinase) family peptidase